MNTRINLGLLLLGFLALILLGSRIGRMDGEGKGTAPAHATVDPTTHPRIEPGQTSLSSTVIHAPARAPQSMQRSPEALLEYITEQNVPVRFFGKVIDQHGVPISGVHVQLSVRHWIVLDKTRFSTAGQSLQFRRTTGTAGEFELTESAGDVLTVETIVKDGYASGATMPRMFGLKATSVSDRDQPMIFRLWAKGPSEPLVTGQKVFGLIPDDRVYSIDLLTGKKHENTDAGGDLKVSIIRPLGAVARSGFDWSFALDAIDGGLVEAADDLNYLAPQTGYQPSYRVPLHGTDPDWTPLVKRSLFLKSRNGQVYARLKIEVNVIYNDKSAIEIDYAVNPAASRNLQPEGL